jgi:hypothetical protein
MRTIRSVPYTRRSECRNLLYEVTGLGPLRTRLQRAAGRGLTKFVGREHKIEAMRHPAELAHEGRGQIVAAMAYARRVATVPAELLMLHMGVVNSYLDILGIRAAEQSSADIDVIAHQTETVRAWIKLSRDKRLKTAFTE